MSVWLYDFLANKIDWSKQDFRKYRRKGAFYRMWFDGTNYRVKMVFTLANFSTADCFQRSLKIGRKNLSKSLNIFDLGDYKPCINVLSICTLTWTFITHPIVHIHKKKYFLLNYSSKFREYSMLKCLWNEIFYSIFL